MRVLADRTIFVIFTVRIKVIQGSVILVPFVAGMITFVFRHRILILIMIVALNGLQAWCGIHAVVAMSAVRLEATFALAGDTSSNAMQVLGRDRIHEEQSVVLGRHEG